MASSFARRIQTALRWSTWAMLKRPAATTIAWLLFLSPLSLSNVDRDTIDIVLRDCAALRHCWAKERQIHADTHGATIHNTSVPALFNEFTQILARDIVKSRTSREHWPGKFITKPFEEGNVRSHLTNRTSIRKDKWRNKLTWIAQINCGQRPLDREFCDTGYLTSMRPNFRNSRVGTRTQIKIRNTSRIRPTMGCKPLRWRPHFINCIRSILGQNASAIPELRQIIGYQVAEQILQPILVKFNIEKIPIVIHKLVPQCLPANEPFTFIRIRWRKSFTNNLTIIKDFS